MQGTPGTRIVLVALALFVAATFEALLFPGAYRAAALVAVEASGAEAESSEPVRLSRRLEEVTLDAGLLGELVRARGSDASGALSALTLRRAISFLSADGRTFEVSFTDSSPERAQELCNLVAQRAVSRAPSIFGAELAGSRATARLVTASSRPSWPTPYQSWLLALGAMAGLVASGSAVAWRAWLAPRKVRPASVPSDEEGLEPAQATPEPAPATERIRRPPAPAPANAPPAEAAMTLAPRTDPMLPPPTPLAFEIAPTAAQRRSTSMGMGAQPIPLPRRSTLILGSPIAPTPIPTKPTPTSIFRPSPLPPYPDGSPAAPGVSSYPPPTATSTLPPPATASRSPSSHPLDRSGARYSYVSTPVPARPSANVTLRDVAVELDPTLNTEIHKPFRRQLFSLGVAQCFVTVVTSVGEAQREKGRFALELALCLAETGHARVLLIEADLGEPELARLLRVKLVEGESLERQLAAEGDRPRPWSLLRCNDSLQALLQETPAQPELILGEQFRDCVIGLCGSFDFIVMNGPPTETGLAGRPFTSWVDGAVIVASDEQSSGALSAKEAFGLKQFLRVYSPGAAVR